MVWVRSEHGGALAIVSTWLCVLLPWNVTYTWNLSGVNLLFVRFLFAEVQFLWGLSSHVAMRGPLSALSPQLGQTVAVVYQAWVVGAAALVLTVLFSPMYYLRDERVEAGPVNPARVLGGLLGVAGAVFAAMTRLLVTHGISGIPFPLGVVISLVPAGVLLTVNRT